MTAPPLPLHRPSRVTWLDLLAVAVLTFAAFTPVLRSQFSPMDDYLMISGNEKVTRPTWDHFRSHWTEPSFRIYMPLALSLWQGIAMLSHVGDQADHSYVLLPIGFKIVSLITHAAAAVAAAWTLSILTTTRWPAVIGAMVFAVHPVQVESVAWTTGLKDEMCGLFCIVAIGSYAIHARANPVSPWRSVAWWFALVAAALAMLAKPTAMVLPVLLLAVDWVSRRADTARRLVSLVPILMPAIACALIILTVQANAPVAPLPLPWRPLVAADTFGFYLGKLVWPANLSVDYGRRPSVIMDSGVIRYTWIVPAAAAIGVALTRSRRVLLAAALFVVPVLPVSGLTAFDMQQYSTVTDHYLYLPMLGVGLALALLIAWRPLPAGAVAVAAVCVLSVTTWRAATRWENLEAFYARMLVTNPRSWLARDLLSVMASYRGDLFNAKRLNDEALAVNPEGASTLSARSAIMLARGRYREAADVGVLAARDTVIKRLDVARRVTLLGSKLKDLDVTEKGLSYWLLVEPRNEYVMSQLQSIRKIKRQQAATTRAVE